MALFLILLITITTIFNSNAYEKTDYPLLPIKQVIIWGYKLHTHTHSYVHWGFYRAFKELGYETYWLGNNDSTDNLNLTGTLFITAGNADQKIPLRHDCFYILHNCDVNKYEHLEKRGNCIKLQVYTHDCLHKGVQKLDDCMYYNINDNIIYLPWATDLLPHEIDKAKEIIKTVTKNKSAVYIGTIWDGIFGNRKQINLFKYACGKNNIAFQHRGGCSMEDNMKLVQFAYMAPAIQGKWQCEKGYIPCRIFKNISYGALGITNSSTVYELFGKKIIYNTDICQLFYDAQEKLKNFDINEQYELMDFVKNKHTYINRIQSLLNFFQMVRENYV